MKHAHPSTTPHHRSSTPSLQRRTQQNGQRNNTRDYCGCPWLDMPYAEQLREKNRSMHELFNPWIKQHSCTLNPIIGMEYKDGVQPCGFRYKVATPFAEARTGRHAQKTRDVRDAGTMRNARTTHARRDSASIVFPTPPCPTRARFLTFRASPAIIPPRTNNEWVTLMHRLAIVGAHDAHYSPNELTFALSVWFY